MTDVTKKPPSALVQARREDALSAARDYVEKARAKSTRRAYASDWRIFEHSLQVSLSAAGHVNRSAASTPPGWLACRSATIPELTP